MPTAVPAARILLDVPHVHLGLEHAPDARMGRDGLGLRCFRRHGEVDGAATPPIMSDPEARGQDSLAGFRAGLVIHCHHRPAVLKPGRRGLGMRDHALWAAAQVHAGLGRTTLPAQPCTRRNRRTGGLRRGGWRWGAVGAVAAGIVVIAAVAVVLAVGVALT